MKHYEIDRLRAELEALRKAYQEQSDAMQTIVTLHRLCDEELAIERKALELACLSRKDYGDMEPDFFRKKAQEAIEGKP